MAALFFKVYYFDIEILNYTRGISLTILFRKLLLPIITSLYFYITVFFKKFIYSKNYISDMLLNYMKLLFVWLTSLIGLIFIVNIAFKNFWGRARPNEVVDFGGTE